MSVQHSKRQNNFGFSCPSGGNWYSCSVSTFVGCCAADPCTSGCSKENIRPASFVGNYYAKFPNANCTEVDIFYTCKGDGIEGHMPFWGCCLTNPCGDSPSCPAASLLPAYLDLSLPAQVSAYKPFPAPTVSTAAFSILPTTSATSTATPSNPGTPLSQTQKKTPIVAIAGGAGAGLALIIVALLIFFLVRKKRSPNQHSDYVSEVLPEKTSIYAFHPPAADSEPRYELPEQGSANIHHRLSELESPWPSPPLHSANSTDGNWGAPIHKLGQSSPTLGTTIEESDRMRYQQEFGGNPKGY